MFGKRLLKEEMKCMAVVEAEFQLKFMKYFEYGAFRKLTPTKYKRYYSVVL